MNVTMRHYKHPEDFKRVGQFLIDTYQSGIHHDNWLQPRWEYMHFHPDLNVSAFNTIGIWESDGWIIGVAHYEMDPGEVFFQVHPDFRHLKPEMLDYAEKYLSIEQGNTSGIFAHIARDEKSISGKKIILWVNDFDTELESVVGSRGYQLVEGVKECWSFFDIPEPFPAVRLPAGFRMQSLADEDDLGKLTRLLHRGFNHPGEPSASAIQGTAKMQSAPNYRKDLNIVVVASDGTYAAYGGIWQDYKNKIAYIEPVCTDPDFRRMGLGTAVVLEGFRRCGAEGTRVAMVGSEQPFYLSMGFKKIFDIRLWIKQICYSGENALTCISQ